MKTDELEEEISIELDLIESTVHDRGGRPSEYQKLDQNWQLLIF
jgi:hypothetical protein